LRCQVLNVACRGGPDDVGVFRLTPSFARNNQDLTPQHSRPDTERIAMTLKQRISDDMKTAMRAKEADRLLAIRNLMAAMKQREVDERVELDDAAIVAIVDKLVKQRKDSIDAFAKAGRTDLVDKETGELNVLLGYLPERLDAAAIAAEVQAIVEDLGASGPGDMGKVMGAVKARLAGKADMGQVSAAVKAALSK